MKPRIKKLWLEALRSGEYQRGTEALRRDNKFCCLGVLTDLFINKSKAGMNYPWEPDKGEDRFNCDLEGGCLPNVVVDWAGLDNNNPDLFETRDGDWVTCASANDKRYGQRLAYTQRQIADMIEKYL